MDKELKILKLGFWKTKTGNFTTHSHGLTAENIQALQELKIGDRMILWVNNNKLTDMSPDMSLKLFKTEGMK